MRFCPFCGQPLFEPPPVREERSPVEAVKLITVPVVAVLLIIELAYMVAGAGETFAWCADHSMNVLALVPTLVVATTISGTALQVAWVLLVLAILASVVALVWRSYRQMMESGGLDRGLAKTDLYRTSTLFALSLGLSVVSSLVLMAVGSGIQTPDGIESGFTADALLAYADAAVWEEVISRVAYIGIPMTVAALVLRRGRRSFRFLLGGFGLSRLSVALIVISALVFGFAHMSGWGVEKVLPTMLSGLVMGFAYVTVGLHASIAIHFLTDYMAVAAFTDMVVVVALIMLALIVLGCVCLVSAVIDLRKLPEALRGMPNWLPDQESSRSSTDED